MHEYSFFRAEGRSLQAIDRVKEAKAKVKELSQQLAKRYGASDYAPWRDDEFGSFVFEQGASVPETFDVQDNSRQSEEFRRSQPTFAWPKKGTADAFYIASFKGLIDREVRHLLLEYVLDCGDMPMKELPAGRYSGIFVRMKTWTGPEYNLQYPEPNSGKITDPMVSCYGSSNGGHSADRLSFVEFCGVMYIRVPNDETGKPRMTPPDSTPVSYEEMLEIDRQEYERRYPHLKTPKPNGP